MKAKKTSTEWGKPYGYFPYSNEAGHEIYLRRKVQRCRWFDVAGHQVGPEQSNVGPAIAWAHAHGFYDPRNRALFHLAQAQGDPKTTRITRRSRPNRSSAPSSGPSGSSGLRYRVTPLEAGWRSEVYWADRFRGIRDKGRAALDRLARRAEEAVNATADGARKVVRDFDEAFLHTVDVRANKSRRKR